MILLNEILITHNLRSELQLVIYLDESGDLGFERGTRFFIIVILAAHNRKELAHCVKRVRQRKLKKNPPAELKAFKVTDSIRSALLRYIARQNIEIYAFVLDKSLIPEKLRKEPNIIYNYCASAAIERCVENNYIQELVVDMRGDLMARVDFDKYIKRTVGDIKINHVESQNSELLQITDFVAWSIHRKYESNDDRFYDLISNKIRSEILWN